MSQALLDMAEGVGGGTINVRLIGDLDDMATAVYAAHADFEAPVRPPGSADGPSADAPCDPSKASSEHRSPSSERVTLVLSRETAGLLREDVAALTDESWAREITAAVDAAVRVPSGRDSEAGSEPMRKVVLRCARPIGIVPGEPAGICCVRFSVEIPATHLISRYPACPKCGARQHVERIDEESDPPPASRVQDSAACDVKLWHGPGHQSSTVCRRTGEHEYHEVSYVGPTGYYGLAQWKGGDAFTGIDDEPPDPDMPDYAPPASGLQDSDEGAS